MKKNPSIKKQELEPLFKAREYGELIFDNERHLLIVEKVIQKHTTPKMTLIKGAEVRLSLTIENDTQPLCRDRKGFSGWVELHPVGRAKSDF